MKRAINKSELMKRAWAYFRSEKTMSFGACLKQIWKSMKIELAYLIKKATMPSHDDSMLIAYNNGSLAYRPGQYVGD